MIAVRQSPFFFALLAVLLAACLSGLWYLGQISGELDQLRTSYETKSSQYERYLAARPSPTRSNLEALEENYRELHEVYERTMSSLNLNTFDKESFFGTTPNSRADWSFELHKFKENARYAALSNSIELPAEVDFGFKDYVNGGPSGEEGQRIHEQIVIISSLLETLFDSGITSFVAVQRGVSQDSKTVPANRRPADKLIGEDERFAIQPGQSLSIPGTVDSYVFRVAFKGQSFALRGFLNRVASSSLPFVIRGVESSLSGEDGELSELESRANNPFAADTPVSSNEDPNVPIISNNTSLFVVTLEFLQLAVEVAEPDQAGGRQDA